MNFTIEHNTATALDANDPLATYRQAFHLPMAHGEPLVYLCGHSLGLQPQTTLAAVMAELQRWQTLAVQAHFQGPRPWFDYHEQLTAGLAILTGALPIEVVAMNSLTVNLHLMLTSFYRPTQTRYKILIEQDAFPSDRYAVMSHLQTRGIDPAHALLIATPGAGETLLRTEDLLKLIAQHGSSIATIVLPGVHYLSGQLLDIPTLTQAAQAQGCTIGFDLAHAIANVPLQLHEWNVDFAVWCSYKYLNAGPGAIGGCFVHERHAQHPDRPRLAGWWGHNKTQRFATTATFQPTAGAAGWQLSNPPILAAAPLLASLQLFQTVNQQQLHAKARALSAYLHYLLKALLKEKVHILTPTDPNARGCQCSLRLPGAQAAAVQQQLHARGILCDLREPDILRVAAVPLYNTFTEVWLFCTTLNTLLM